MISAGGRRVSRAVTFLPGAAGGTWWWDFSGRPLHLAGLAAMAGIALVLWPVLVMTVLLSPGVAAGVLIPRRWRISHRRRHGRGNCRSARISARLRRAVLAADRYRCAFCRSRVDIQVDHIRPWSGGGLTVFSNVMCLCRVHNLAKLDYWRDRDGYEHYRREQRGPAALAAGAAILAAEFRRDRDGYEHYRREQRSPAALAAGAAILAAEFRHRRNPLRLIRAAWALGA